MLINDTTTMIGDSLISFLLPLIINQYLWNTYCLTIVSDDAINLHFDVSFTLVTPSDEVEMLWSQLLELSDRGCSDYIVNMKNPQKFMKALDQISRKGTVRRSDKKIIILPYSNDTDITKSGLELISMRESSYVADLLIILKNYSTNNKCEVYDLITHKFLKADGDEPLFLNKWNSCTKKFESNENLFPHNKNDLKGRVIKVATFTYKPYVFLNLDLNIEPLGRDGLEMRIIDEFCRRRNCSIEIVDEEKEQWGEVFENGTGVGIIGSVVEDKADLGIAALYSWFQEFLYLDFSAACVRSAVTVVAPSPRLLSSWEMPLLPFSWHMWYALLVIFIYASIGLTLANGCSSDKVLLKVFGILLSQFQKIESSWRIRGIVGWLFSGSMVLLSAYGAGLASIFSVPKYEPSIDTIKDMVNRKMEWGATHDAWIFSLTMSEEPLIKQLVSLFRIKTAKELKKRSFMRNMAFTIEKLPAGHYAIGDYITKEALLDMTEMKEDFYYEQCVIMLRKSSPYTEKMSELVGRLHQFGLLQAWETQVSLKYLNFEIQQEVKLSRMRTGATIIRPLSLRIIGGVFILYGTGVVLAILFFIGEFIFRRLTVYKEKSTKLREIKYE